MRKINRTIALLLSFICLFFIVGCSAQDVKDGGFVKNENRGEWVDIKVDDEIYKFKVINEESDWDIVCLKQEGINSNEYIQIYEYGGSHKPFTNGIPEFIKDLNSIKNDIDKENDIYNVIRKDKCTVEIYTENGVEHDYRITSVVIIKFNNKPHYMYFKTDESLENIKQLMSDIEIN